MRGSEYCFGEPNDAQTRSESHLGVGLIRHDPFDQLGRERTRFFSPLKMREGVHSR